MLAKNTENKNFTIANKGNKKCCIQLRTFKTDADIHLNTCRHTIYLAIHIYIYDIIIYARHILYIYICI